MAEQVCPTCRAGNPPDNRYCGRCGSRLRYHELEEAPVIEKSGGRGTPDLLPDLDVQRLTRTVAISVGALVAEVALQQIRRRMLSKGGANTRTAASSPSAARGGVAALVGLALLAAERHLNELDSGSSVKQILKGNSTDGGAK